MRLWPHTKRGRTAPTSFRRVPWPTPSRPVSVRNGVLEASRSAVPVAVFLTPPWTYWPPWVHSASLPGASVLGLGATATLSRVVGSGGNLRTVGDPAAHLVDIDVIAWFRRARRTSRPALDCCGRRRPDRLTRCSGRPRIRHLLPAWNTKCPATNLCYRTLADVTQSRPRSADPCGGEVSPNYIRQPLDAADGTDPNGPVSFDRHLGQKGLARRAAAAQWGGSLCRTHAVQRYVDTQRPRYSRRDRCHGRTSRCLHVA